MLNVILTTMYQNKLQLLKIISITNRFWVNDMASKPKFPNTDPGTLPAVYFLGVPYLKPNSVQDLSTNNLRGLIMAVECGRNPKCVMWGCARTRISKHFCNLCNMWTVVPFQNVYQQEELPDSCWWLPNFLKTFIILLVISFASFLCIWQSKNHTHTHTTIWFEHNVQLMLHILL